MFEADHRFRRVNGHLYLPKLPALSKHRSPRTQCRSHDEGQKRAAATWPGSASSATRWPPPPPWYGTAPNWSADGLPPAQAAGT